MFKPIHLNRSFYLAIALFSICLIGSGCSKKKLKTNSVIGKVFVDGKPAKGAQVTFMPVSNKDSKASAPTGVVAEDGTFKLSTYSEGDGAPAGEYTVLVSWSEVDPKTKSERPLVPGRYHNPKESDLHVTINAGDNQLAAFELPSMEKEMLSIARQKRRE